MNVIWASRFFGPVCAKCRKRIMPAYDHMSKKLMRTVVHSYCFDELTRALKKK